MGAKTINPVSLALAGGAITKTDSLGTTSSIIVAPTTAQSSLNLPGLSVIFENYSSTASCTITLESSDLYSDKGIGDAAAITLATGASIAIGGKALEGARYLNDDGYLYFTITTAATVYAYATMFPYTILNG